MLREHSDRVLTFFSATFELRIGFLSRLYKAAEALQNSIKARHWSIGRGAMLRDIDRNMLFMLDHQNLAAQALAYLAWESRVDELSPAFREALKGMDVKKVKRAGFKTVAYIPTDMTHPEMVELLFGSFLPPPNEFEAICGQTNDALVQLHGVREGMSYIVTVAPMTVEQATGSFQAWPNFEHYLDDPKWFDDRLKLIREKITSSDCLYVDVDVSKMDVDPTELSFFMQNSLKACDDATAATVNKLKSLQAK